jgi:hypothetical protein
MTRKSFDGRLLKGEYGEAIVRGLLEAKGFVVYKPFTEGAHAFDVLAIKDKARCIALDVKAKARRNKYEDTGIPERHYRTYLNFSTTHNMPFWVVFVDEMLGAIYGNTISKLDAPVSAAGINYPHVYGGDNGTRYWHLSSMVTLSKLSEVQIGELKGLSQRQHEYGH